MSTTTLTPIRIDNFHRESYLKGYAVVIDGETVGDIYQCISGGWTGATEQVHSSDGTETYNVRTVWVRRRDAIASVVAASR